MYTVTIEQLSFKQPYRIRATRNDFMHAFIVWFDIRFSKCHKPIYFSTCTFYLIYLEFKSDLFLTLAPVAKYTHWKQTVFYQDDVLGITEGDEISGTIEGRPNARNHRDWDIAIQADFDGQYGAVHKKSEYTLR